MSKSKMLIETDRFLAVQLRYGNEREAAMIAATTHDRVGIFYDTEGCATDLVATDDTHPEVRVAEGEFIYTDFTRTGVVRTAEELLDLYEATNGEAVEGDSVVEKLVTIEFAEFVAQLGDYDTPEWEWASLPYNQTRKDFLQRARYGMSDADWWNFDIYFANVMIHMATKFRDEKHGVPSDANTSLEESIRKWDEKMDTIINGFKYYLEAEEMDYVDYDPEPLRKAFDAVRDNYHHLVD